MRDIAYVALLTASFALLEFFFPVRLIVSPSATVEGVVAKMFTSNKGNTFLNVGAAYPNQTFTLRSTSVSNREEF